MWIFFVSSANAFLSPPFAFMILMTLKNHSQLETMLMILPQILPVYFWFSRWLAYALSPVESDEVGGMIVPGSPVPSQDDIDAFKTSFYVFKMSVVFTRAFLSSDYVNLEEWNQPNVDSLEPSWPECLAVDSSTRDVCREKERDSYLGMGKFLWCLPLEKEDLTV